MIFRMIMKALRLFALISLPIALIILIIWTVEHEPIEDVFRAYLGLGAIVWVLARWFEVLFFND